MTEQLHQPAPTEGKGIIAYHWLRSDMRSGHGDEPPWTVGEERTIQGEVIMCRNGYHSLPTLYAGLGGLSGVGQRACRS